MEDLHEENVAQEEGSKEDEEKVKKEDILSPQKASLYEAFPSPPEEKRESEEAISGTEKDVDTASGEDKLQEATIGEAESEVDKRIREGAIERPCTKIRDLHLAPDEELSVFSSQQIAFLMIGATLIALLVGGLAGSYLGQLRTPKKVIRLIHVEISNSSQRESAPAFPDKDIPGEDIPDIPRPPDTVRTLFDFSPCSSSVGYVAPGDKSEAYMVFFSEQMPSLGWKLLKAQKQKGNVSMNFQKNKANAQIDIIYFSGMLGSISQTYSGSYTQVDIRKTH